MRDFEKINFAQFSKDICDDREFYDSFELPIRHTEFSAGYDIFLLKDLKIEPGEIVKISTGLKAYFEQDEVLLIILRGSMGFKYNLRLVNQIGVIDADYYSNELNDGHIFIKVQNEGSNKVCFKAGDSIVQGIFVKYLTTKSDNILRERRLLKYK